LRKGFEDEDDAQMIGAKTAAQVQSAQPDGDTLAVPDGAPEPGAWLGRVPRHVGIIMDGNGRWAAQRGLPRIEGHRRGVEALRATVRAAIDFGLDYLTVYSL
jgi:undecaprenyl pyrophosphate synthase